MKGGEVLRGQRVLSTLDAHSTLIRLMDKHQLPVDFVRSVEAIEYTNGYIQIHLTLKQLPQFIDQLAFVNGTVQSWLVAYIRSPEQLATAELKRDDSGRIDELVEQITARVIQEFSTRIAPQAWAKARAKLREYITRLVRSDVREVVDNLLDRFSREADGSLDIDEIMRQQMTERRELLGQVLVEIASPEFRFIERSGLYFGFLFGIGQMAVWTLYPVFWTLPAAGFLVGYATNWMAMNLIFEPKEPRRIGPFTLQGVFIKRQHEVAGHFADVICDQVLTAANLVRHLCHGPPCCAACARRTTRRVVPCRPWRTTRSAFAGSSTTSLRALDAAAFSGILRPVFQKDEWKLLLAGGVIGVVIGAMQYLLLFQAQ